MGVDGVRRQIEPVAPGNGAQHRRVRQGPAQPGHQRLHRVRAVGGLVLRPQGVRQLLDGDDPSHAQREPDQQHPEPRAPDLDGLTAGRHLQRSQDVHVHTSTVPPTTHKTLAACP